MEINRIYNVDCFDAFKNLGDKSVDKCFTSPPYNRKRNDKYKFYDDIIPDYFKFLCDFTNEAIRVTKDWVIINMQVNYYNKSDVYHFIGEYHDSIKNIIIWEKTNPLPANGHNITNAYEMFIVIGDKSLKSNTTYTKNFISTSINTETSKLHKAIMKREVCDWFIEKFTNKGDIVLDPFMGSGTTAISCMDKKRNYIGFEKVKEYYDLSIDRIKKHISE